MELLVVDRLYGPMEFSRLERDLFRTKEIARLREVSQSAVPPQTVPTGTCATRFEHSLGVAYLTRMLSRRMGFRHIARELFAAALAHDIGSPPFSHLGEQFLQSMLGKDHEQYAAEVMSGSEFAQVLTAQKIDVDLVMALIEGKHPPISQVTNGSIDIDNLDNVLRYAVSIGLVPFGSRSPYSPKAVAGAFRMHNGQLCLKAEAEPHICGWARCRKRIYDFIYSTANLAPGAMVARAIELARRMGQIHNDFFRLTDAQAYQYLERCCRATRDLMEQARLWHWYICVFERRITDAQEVHPELFGSSYSRHTLSDALAKELKISPELVTTYVGKSRGFKKIEIPLLGQDGSMKEWPTLVLEPSWNVQVFLHPVLAEIRLYKESVKGYLHERFGF